MTDTINSLIKQAYDALERATEIADQTRQEFDFNLGDTGVTYYPTRPVPVYTKKQALNLLSSGKELTIKEREDIAYALNDETEDNDGWRSSFEGWVSSSDQC
jgi:ATP-dependent exoDNAse (exonuclease V) alpha subunit